MSLLLVNPILNGEMLARVRAAAALDPRGHDPRFATDVVTRDGEIVGAMAICSLPISNVWLHSEKCHARDSKFVINFARSITHRLNGGKAGLTMCSPASPLLPFMDGFGFHKIGETILFEERSVV